jgi:oxygen-independent coproporphyrinogen-3 oxidase
MPQTHPQDLSLYFHIPFCTQKCDYCHFYVLPEKDLFKQQLMTGLQLEWERVKPLTQGHRIVSIYFGGGTPSLLGVDAIAKILSWIEGSCHVLPAAEITLEANPENISLPLIKGYANAGINRLSLGIQSFDPQLLKILHRSHTAEKALQAVDEIASAGIKNISIDLMYDIPHQTLDQWQHTLDLAVQLPITHLSFYNLTIEPYTKFYKKKQDLERVVPDAETSLKMLTQGIQHLEAHGLKRYEISAFARGNYQSQHNLGYWTARPFFGLGPSAFSYWEGSRYRNIAHLGKYLTALQSDKSPVDFEEKLDDDAHVRELLAVELRLMQGVDLFTFEKRHGTLSLSILAVMQRLIQEGFLQQSAQRFCLSELGKNFYDSVAAEIISESC